MQEQQAGQLAGLPSGCACSVAQCVICLDICLLGLPVHNQLMLGSCDVWAAVWPLRASCWMQGWGLVQLACRMYASCAAVQMEHDCHDSMTPQATPPLTGIKVLNLDHSCRCHVQCMCMQSGLADLLDCGLPPSLLIHQSAKVAGRVALGEHGQSSLKNSNTEHAC
jgi:hypothetical protein